MEKYEPNTDHFVTATEMSAMLSYDSKELRRMRMNNYCVIRSMTYYYILRGFLDYIKKNTKYHTF